MPLTPSRAIELLKDHHLLRGTIGIGDRPKDAATVSDDDLTFAAITYDTRSIVPGSLLICKGRFQPRFLDWCDGRGLAAYVAEADMSEHTDAPGLIVEDARKAMSLLAAEFYGRPQDELTLIGITGTKGKTTTAYFTQAVLNAHSQGRCALFSSVDNCLDGHTYAESDLTTPESLDAFRMMREAVDNGMRYLVMEVSSQAYKVNRVYGLTFDIGAFLNISPDHISPIEHPTFEDYLHCKRQIVANSRTLVLGADSDHADLLREDAARAHTPVTTFALHDPATGHTTPADVAVRPDRTHKTGIIVTHAGAEEPFVLDMLGEFNFLNAGTAVALAMKAGVPFGDPAMHAVERVQVPGRMERFSEGDDLRVYVDFAHNYMSVNALVDEMMRVYGDRAPRITLVAGSTGGKAIDRREGIVKGALGRAESFILTLDDPNFEDPRKIAEEMASHVTDPKARAKVIVDREEAIATAIAEARASVARDGRFNIVLVVGKGHETRNIIDGKAVAWPGDAVVVRRELGLD